LLNEEGERIYDFEASYTLADLGEGMRITAITHSKVPRNFASTFGASSSGLWADAQWRQRHYNRTHVQGARPWDVPLALEAVDHA
jgi:hypothetical protein